MGDSMYDGIQYSYRKQSSSYIIEPLCTNIEFKVLLTKHRNSNSQWKLYQSQYPKKQEIYPVKIIIVKEVIPEKLWIKM